MLDYIFFASIVALVVFDKEIKKTVSILRSLWHKTVVERSEAKRRKTFIRRLEKAKTYSKKWNIVDKILFDHPAGLSKKDYLLFLEHLGECTELDNLHHTLLSRVEDFNDVSIEERNSILSRYGKLKKSDHNYLVDFVFDRVVKAPRK